MRMEEIQEEKAGKNRMEKDWFCILNRNVEEVEFLPYSLPLLIDNTPMVQNRIIRHYHKEMCMQI